MTALAIKCKKPSHHLLKKKSLTINIDIPSGGATFRNIMPYAEFDALFSTSTFVHMDDEDLYHDVKVDFFSVMPDLNNVFDLRHSFQKKVTNKTYLKRMYINQQFTKSFIPSLDDVFRNKATKCHNQRVTLMNVAGRTWVVDFEIVKSRKQLHCRLRAGWSLFCHDNGVDLNDCLVFQQMTFGDQCTLLVSVRKAK